MSGRVEEWKSRGEGERRAGAKMTKERKSGKEKGVRGRRSERAVNAEEQSRDE